MNARAHQPTEQAHRQAARWAARLDRPGLEAAEGHALESWLAEDPNHRGLLAEYCQLSADAERWLPQAFPQGAVQAAPPARLRVGWRWAAGLAAALALGVFTWSVRPAGSPGQIITTLPAQRHMVRLADGTRADLNARSTAVVDYRPDERRLELRAGEVLLDVAKDAARPFVVTTPAGAVTVTGTRFNVRLPGPAALEVTVLEGSVTVQPGRDGYIAIKHTLHPGDQLLLNDDVATVRRLPLVVAEDMAAWRDGTLVFTQATLAEVVQRYADYHDRSVTVDPAVAKLLLGGRFSLDDWDGFFAALERIVPVRAVREGDGVRLVSAKP